MKLKKGEVKEDLGGNLIPAGLIIPEGMDEQDVKLNLFFFGCGTKNDVFDIDFRFFYTLCNNGGVILSFNQLCHKLESNYVTTLKVAKKLEKAEIIEMLHEGRGRVIKLSKKYIEKVNEHLKYVQENDVEFGKFNEEMFKNW